VSTARRGQGGGNTGGTGDPAPGAGPAPGSGSGGTGDPPTPPGRILIVGYGNPLRHDDGAGRDVADALWARRDRAPELARASFSWAHQLTPELAADLADVELAVFLDAAADGQAPGAVTVRYLGPEAVSPGRRHPSGPVPPGELVPGSALPALGQPAGFDAAGCWTDITPVGLLRLAAALFGRAPDAVIVTVTAGDLSLGEGLSREVETAVPCAAASARLAIDAWRRGGRPGAPGPKLERKPGGPGPARSGIRRA